MAYQEKTPIKGWVCLFFWGALIAAGIIAKRVYGHPDMMVFFHLPAAVFLVMAAHSLSRNFRVKYQQSIQGREASEARSNGYSDVGVVD